MNIGQDFLDLQYPWYPNIKKWTHKFMIYSFTLTFPHNMLKVLISDGKSENDAYLQRKTGIFEIIIILPHLLIQTNALNRSNYLAHVRTYF